MKWSMACATLRVQLVSVEDSPPYKFEILFCVASSRLIDLNVNDSVYVSLKGATIESKPESSIKENLPFRLVFRKGWALKYISCPKSPELCGSVVDAWEGTLCFSVFDFCLMQGSSSQQIQGGEWASDGTAGMLPISFK